MDHSFPGAGAGAAAGVPRDDGRTWVVILAGGQGERLADLTCGPDGRPVPKQFCSFDGRRSLLATTLERAGRVAPAERQLAVVAAEHEPWWRPELARLPRANVLSQPVPRGTAAALLLAALHVARLDPGAQLTVLPSDHYVADERVLARALRLAAAASRLHAGRPVLLGIEPEQPDSGYGWIVPGNELEPTRRIRAFVEKPAPARAVALMEQGAVWSSFMLTSAVRPLLNCYDRALPALLAAFRQGLGGPARPDAEALRRTYARVPSFDFSRHVLETCPDEARVLPVPWCGWSDLGTPERVAACAGLRGPIANLARARVRGTRSAAEAVARELARAT